MSGRARGGARGAAIALVLAAAAPARAQVSPYLELVTEAGGGEAPVVAGAEPEGGVAFTVAPTAAVQLGRGPRRLTLGYAPRLTLRRPNQAERERPLLLHTFALAGELAPAETFRATAQGSLSVGEADYNVLPGLVGPTQGALPEVQDLLVAVGGLELSQALGRRTLLGVRGEVTHRRTLGDPPRPEPGTDPLALPTLPRQTGLSAGPYLAHQLTARDRLELATELAYERREGDLSFLVAGAGAGWQRDLARHHRLTLVGGLAWSRVDARDSLGQRLRTRDLWPVGEARYATRGLRSAGLGLELGVDLLVENQVDPVLNLVGPRGSAQGRAVLLPRADWRLSLEAGFGTSLRDDALPAGPGLRPPDETVVLATLGAEHQLSHHLALRTSARWSDRGPHLDADDFAWHQRELWLMVAAIVRTRPLDRTAR